MSRSRLIRGFALPLVVAMLLAACGGGGGGAGSTDGGETPQPEGTPDDGATAQDGQAAFSLDEPIRFVLLVQNPATSTDPNVVPDYPDGAKMAIDEINAAGGIGGVKLEMEIVETPPVGQEVISSFNRALEANPTVLLGPVSSAAQAVIGAERINNAGIPQIHSVTTREARIDGKIGSEWSFGIRPTNELMATAAADYAVNTLGADKIGLLHIGVAYGANAAAAQKAFISGTDAEVVAERSFKFNATDLTQEVRAMAGTGAVLDWGTPNTQALAVRTFAQQGITKPVHVIPNGPAFNSFRDAVGDPSLLSNAVAILDCNPLDAERAAQWVQRWRDRYGYPPSYAGAEFYDAVKIVAHVIRQQQSASPEAIQQGLSNLNYEDGICGQTYRNIDHVLMHQSVVAEIPPDTLKTVKRFDLTGYEPPQGG